MIGLQKQLPQKTSLMIGRTEIPKWIGQDFEVWKKELEKWRANDKSSEETKFESLMKNEKVKEFMVNTVTEKTERDRTVESILKVLKGKYARKIERR